MTNNNTTDKTVRTGTVKLDQHRAFTEWAPIENVMPNPLNPRKRDDYKTEELQQVLREKGWEMPLTCYKKGQMYVVLSGHRRLYAARQMKCREVPIYCVPQPRTHQEEIERIASAQAHQQDWDVLEWAKFTYERWIAWGKPAFTKFAKNIGLAKRTVETYCTVLDYYPMEEVEAGLRNKTFNISMLYELTIWIRDIKKHHPFLINQLSEDLIRRAFLSKMENKKISREALRKREYLMVAPDKDLKEFFTQPEMSLEEIMLRKEISVNEKTFHGKMVSVGFAKSNIKKVIPKNKIEAGQAVKALADLQEQINNQLKEIERNFPEAIEKEDLFTWKKKK